MSRLLLRTRRDAPADAEAASHQLLVRGGYIRRTSSGAYAFLPRGLRVVADPSVGQPVAWVTGANRADHHVTGAVAGRDFQVGEWVSIATIAAGDACPVCAGPVDLVRSVEAAHTFQLGRRYSEVLAGATFAD